MSTAPIESLPTAERRRLIAIGLLRALATTVLVVAAYYLLPLNNLAGISLGERRDLALHVEQQHDEVSRQIDIGADDSAQLVDEFQIVERPAVQPGGLEAADIMSK